jgi:hypothetical protein
VGIRRIRGNPLKNPCESEGISLMFDRGEKRLTRRKEIHVIVLGDGW